MAEGYRLYYAGGVALEEKIDNRLKQENYREQFKRLNRAMSNAFYLEAVFIEYSIMEDRTESILKRMGKWESHKKKYGKGHKNISRKLENIEFYAQEQNTIANKYFGDELIDMILEWKGKRNDLIHKLLKQSLTTEYLKETAVEGKKLAETLRNRSTSFKRAVQKQQESI